MLRLKKMSLAVILLLAIGLMAQSESKRDAPQTQGAKVKQSKGASLDRPDIVKAVLAAAQKDCGCGSCAAKGCEPCRGKNCYYCAAKGLAKMDCGCGGCDPKGCSMCGLGCDVCKFHLAPNATTNTTGAKKTDMH